MMMTMMMVMVVVMAVVVVMGKWSEYFSELLYRPKVTF